MIILTLFLLYALVLSILLGRAGFRAEGTPRNEGAHDRPSRLLIVGATGGTGRELVTQALERGYVVTALARRPAKLDLTHPRLRVLLGNVLDAASVRVAMEGQEAVISTLGHKRFLGPTRILSDGTRSLLGAMKAAGVPRFICATSLGLGDTAGRMGLAYTFFTIPLILPFYFWDKTRQERLIAASGLDWVIVRPGALTRGRPRNRVRSGPGVGGWILTPSVPRADVAAFMLDQLETRAGLHTAISVS